MSAKVEVSEREAILAIGFVLMTIIAVALVQAGVISNPLSLGLVITLTIGLILVGHFLAKIGLISRPALPLWYLFVFGIIMLVYGGIEAGKIPVAFLIAGSTTAEIALANAMFYTLLVIAGIGAAAAVYFLMKKLKKLPA